MEFLVTFLALRHDPWLMLLALVVAAGASFAAFTIYSHLLARGGARHRGWLLLTGLCAGTGIWATHFIAMLAERGAARSYDPALIFASYGLAVLISTVGIAVSLRRGLWSAAMGGALVGAAMAAVQVSGAMAVGAFGDASWQLGAAALALALGVALSAAAWVAVCLLSGLRAVLAGAALLTAAIGIAQLSSMAAISADPLAAAGAPASSIDGPVLGALVAAIAALVLTASYVAALMDGRAMRKTYSHLGEIVDSTSDGLVLADNGRIVSVNSRIAELTRSKVENWKGKAVFGELLTGRRRAGGGIWSCESALVAESGGIPVNVVRRPLHAMSGVNEIFAVTDLRERAETETRLAELQKELRRREQELRQRNFLLDTVLGNMSEGLCMFDMDQKVVLSNARYSALYGLAPDAARAGRHLREIVQDRIDKGLFCGPSPKAYMEERLAPVLKTEEMLHELNDGRAIAIARRPMPGGGWVTMHKDVTGQRRAEQRAVHLAQRDQLTNLPNRELFHQLLTEALAAAARQNRRLAVLILDLDRFKEVNGAFGHGAGSALLQGVAQRLQAAKRKSSLLGRFGDDEFVLAEAVEHPGRDAAALANRIQEELHAPFQLNGVAVEIGATIGIAVSPADGVDADTLLRSADLALDHAKATESGPYCFFEPAMDHQLKERLTLERDLGVALKRGEFELLYQPLVNLERNQVTGFEALLRWNHPKRGLLMPEHFIPAAESAGMLIAIGDWALRQACSEAMTWPGHLKVAVNLSPNQFRSRDFVRSVIGTLATTGLTADRLELEVREQVLQQNPEEALRKLRQLAELGVGIALDDFGAGFASLTYLRQFQFGRAKIDRVFVSGLSEPGDSQVIIRTLARLGAGFNITTTAEGVETKEQLETVRAAGCTEMQGHYFSPPKTAEEVRALLTRWHSEKADRVA
jgi:diguanylate cyclase (GGDEF)-like protein